MKILSKINGREAKHLCELSKQEILTLVFGQTYFSERDSEQRREMDKFESTLRDGDREIEVPIMSGIGSLAALLRDEYTIKQIVSLAGKIVQQGTEIEESRKMLQFKKDFPESPKSSL